METSNLSSDDMAFVPGPGLLGGLGELDLSDDEGDESELDVSILFTDSESGEL